VMPSIALNPFMATPKHIAANTAAMTMLNWAVIFKNNSVRFVCRDAQFILRHTHNALKDENAINIGAGDATECTRSEDGNFSICIPFRSLLQ
jgi:hypothetical protein